MLIKSKPKEFLKIRSRLLDSIDFVTLKSIINVNEAEAFLCIYKIADWTWRIGKYGKIEADPKILDHVCGKPNTAEAFKMLEWIVCKRGWFYFTTKFPFCPSYPRKMFSEKFRKRFLDGKNCNICQSKTFLEIDHIIPVSNGGSHEESNLQVLCRSCNRSKSNRKAASHGC